MGFSKNGTKDEIDIRNADDAKERVLIEAHAVASKPVSELILRMLRANKQKFEFQGIATKSGYMDVTSNGKMYRIIIDLVKSDYALDMAPFEKVKNKDYLLHQLGKFAIYCETIYKILMETVVKQYPSALSWKLTLDKETSTLYIDKEHSRRIGFVIHTLNTVPAPTDAPKTSQATSTSDK